MTSLVIASHGISPVSGCPRLTLPTVGSMKSADLQARPPAETVGKLPAGIDPESGYIGSVPRAFCRINYPK